MNKLAWAMTTAVVALLPLSASPAAADAGFSVWMGDGYPHHHHHHQGYPGWGRPVYVVPPPVYYAPPPVYAMPPAVAFAVPAVPTSPEFVDRAGRTCREYQSTITVGGMRPPSYGTACLMADGSWRIMN